jgi:hypothetical protein
LSLTEDFWDNTDRLSMLQIEQLDKSFTLEKVRAVVFSCDPSKAPGPDEFPFLFYQSCWDIISNDAMKLVHDFYHDIFDISKLNIAFICLLPKKQDAQMITQYRSISLIIIV